ncbi:hypothetical protein D910_10798 [Dendroctonus ponderosae]|uniref:GIY-YIG domain-containing protein n=1 Tax=Dendroctonus ponderosae TaxID=77166 RepID=U4UHN7_DENPD|nr:hypothetical protein D910_10798 [Dendroctonus ponderosae]
MFVVLSRILNILHPFFVEVYFIDYGNKDIVPSDNIRSLQTFPTSFISIPPLSTGFIIAEAHCPAPGVYRVPCSCGRAYIGTTKRSINTRITEHKRSCRLGQTEKSAVAEHALLDGHQIRFDEVDILHQSERYYPRLTREAIEIFKHQNNFNRKEEITALNPDWKRVFRQTACAPKRWNPHA